ncbi:hypothetical protein U1Q18_050795, partial [Sarracenia purpurea var. burkii]
MDRRKSDRRFVRGASRHIRAVVRLPCIHVFGLSRLQHVTEFFYAAYDRKIFTPRSSRNHHLPSSNSRRKIDAAESLGSVGGGCK